MVLCARGGICSAPACCAPHTKCKPRRDTKSRGSLAVPQKRLRTDGAARRAAQGTGKEGAPGMVWALGLWRGRGGAWQCAARRARRAVPCGCATPAVRAQEIIFLVSRKQVLRPPCARAAPGARRRFVLPSARAGRRRCSKGSEVCGIGVGKRRPAKAESITHAPWSGLCEHGSTGGGAPAGLTHVCGRPGAVAGAACAQSGQWQRSGGGPGAPLQKKGMCVVLSALAHRWAVRSKSQRKG
ncbi:MAG: hypothetical protein J3K34DRAFT_151730 [Monoraphidium minutum]|nr:MAG: hypothetical protein J3K34DRAFT_151730 [Monoraphidium minutum]